MTTRPEPAALHAVRAATPLTARDAIAWFTTAPALGEPVTGYLQSPRAATWIRVSADGTVQDIAGSSDVLADAYGMVLFDGHRELRWLRTPDGTGTTVALGEDPATLPPGADITADPPARRGDTHTRLLAGAPRPHSTPGWTTLASGRYTTAHLPWTPITGDVLALDTIEYLVEDAHGNLDVADTRTVGLRIPFPNAGATATNRAERTTP